MQSRPRLVDLRGGRNVPPPSPDDVRPHTPRRSQLRARKQKFRAIVTASVCVVTLLIGYAIHEASYLERFTYQNIAVSGTKSVSPAQIKSFIDSKLQASSEGFISGRNIFVYNYEPLAEDIVANFPRVRRAFVARDTSLGNGLVVSIEERDAFARWCQTESGPCYLLDPNGIVYAAAESVSTSTIATHYIFTGALSTTSINAISPPIGQGFAGTHFAGITSLLTELGGSGVRPLGASLQSETDFFVPLAQGYYLKASYGADPSALVKNLSLILNAEALKGKSELLEYIDLRFGNRVYYKFKGQAQSE